MRLGGETVLSGVDPVREAGGPNRPVVRRVPVKSLAGRLTLELVPRTRRPPVFCALEIEDAGAPSDRGAGDAPGECDAVTQGCGAAAGNRQYPGGNARVSSGPPPHEPTESPSHRAGVPRKVCDAVTL